MQEQKNSKHVQWDQQMLKETQKTRGTFQKIDEPKTPYHKNSDSSEQQMQSQEKTEEEAALQESLYKAKMNSNVNIAELNAKLKQQLDKYHGNEQMRDQQEQERERKKQEFKKKRANHYNEFKLIHQMKTQRWEEEDD